MAVAQNPPARVRQGVTQNMRLIIQIFLAAVVPLVACSCSSQDSALRPVTIEEFKSRALAAHDFLKVLKYHGDFPEWEVYRAGRDIMVRPYQWQQMRGEKPPFKLPGFSLDRVSCVKVSDGWLIGHGDGLHGELWWFSSNGKQSYSITKCGVTDLCRVRERLFVGVGEHMLDRTWGRIDELVKDGPSAKWTVKAFAPLPDYPGFIAVDSSEAMIVVGPWSLSKVQVSGQRSILLWMAPWMLNGANSFELLDDDTAYVGMHQAIVEIRHLRTNPTPQCYVLNSQWIPLAGPRKAK